MSRYVITWTCKWLNCRCHDRFAEMKALVSRRMLYPFPFSVWNPPLLPVAPLFSSWNYSSWGSAGGEDLTVNKGSFRLTSLSLDELAINFAVNDVKHPFHISKKVWNLKCITFRAHNFFAQIHTVQSNRLTVTDSRRDYRNGSELKILRTSKRWSRALDFMLISNDLSLLQYSNAQNRETKIQAKSVSSLSDPKGQSRMKLDKVKSAHRLSSLYAWVVFLTQDPKSSQ